MSITKNKTFRAVAESIVPEARNLGESGWRAFGEIVEKALSQRPASMRRQLGLFVRVLNIWCITKHGRGLAHVNPSTRTQFLEAIQDSKVLLIRRGFWGLRTLAMMGYYARPEIEIGYRAQKLGWQAR